MKKGFTLVEILAVIVILAIIFAIAIPGISNVLSDSTKRLMVTDTERIIDKIKYEMVWNVKFDPTKINETNIESELKISSANIEALNVRVEDRVVSVLIIGKNKWKGLKACGTLEDIKVVSVNDEENCKIITDPYLADTVSVGDYVAYDAGTWETTEAITGGGFGGWTAGQSKSTGVNCAGSVPEIGEPKTYNGWRVLSVSGTGAQGVVTLIHAGTPECFLPGPSNSEYTINQQMINVLVNANPNVKYLNTDYAQSTRYFNCTDMSGLWNDACNEVYDDSEPYYSATNDILKLDFWLYYVVNPLQNNCIWVFTNGSYPDYGIYYVVHQCYDGGEVLEGNYGILGVRPVITLKSGIFNISGEGTIENPFEIGN